MIILLITKIEKLKLKVKIAFTQENLVFFVLFFLCLTSVPTIAKNLNGCSTEQAKEKYFSTQTSVVEQFTGNVKPPAGGFDIVKKQKHPTVIQELKPWNSANGININEKFTTEYMQSRPPRMVKKVKDDWTFNYSPEEILVEQPAKEEYNDSKKKLVMQGNF
jgi:hypothetical protein